MDKGKIRFYPATDCQELDKMVYLCKKESFILVKPMRYQWNKSSFVRIISNKFALLQAGKNATFLSTSWLYFKFIFFIQQKLKEKKTALTSPGKLSSGEQSPKIQDPGSGEQEHVGLSAWCQWGCYNPPTHSTLPVNLHLFPPCRAAPKPCVSSGAHMAAVGQCSPAPPPHGQAAGSPSEAIPARWYTCPQG